MGIATVTHQSAAVAALPCEISPWQIRLELHRIQASKMFASSPCLSRLLDYLVGARLSGRSENLKEYILALDVLGRSPEFDPNTSSIVRVQLSRLRAKLASYYDSEGRDSDLRIVLAKGAYGPRFVLGHAAK